MVMIFFSVLLNYGDFLLTKFGCFRLTLFGDFLLTLTVDGLEMRIGMLKDGICKLECCTDVPNTETIETIKAVERGEVIGPFDSIEALMEELDSPEDDF